MAVPAAARPRPAILAVALVTGFGPFGTDAYLPALPAVGAALAIPAAVSQLSITVFLAGLAVGQLVAGPVSDALGRRRPVLAAAVLLVATSALCVVARDAATLLVPRALQGLAAGAGAAIGTAIVADRYRGAAAAKQYGTLSAIRLVAPVVAPAAGGLILLVTDFRGVFLFMTALSAVVLLVAALGIPETLAVADRQPGGVRRLAARSAALLARPGFRAPVVVQCLATAGFFTYIGGSTFVLQQRFGIGESLYAVVFASDAAAMVLTSALFRWLVPVAGASRLRSLGLGLSVAGAAALLAVELATAGGATLPVVWVLLAVSVAGNGFTLPATTVLAQEAGRGSSGAAASLTGGSSFLVGAATTPLTGLLGVQTVPVMALAMAVLPALAVVASRVLGRPAAAAAGRRSRRG